MSAQPAEPTGRDAGIVLPQVGDVHAVDAGAAVAAGVPGSALVAATDSGETPPAARDTASPISFAEYRYLVLSDLYRITGNASKSTLLRHVLAGGPYKYSFWMRTCRYAKSHALLRYTLHPIARIVLNHLTYKFGISIPADTSIGSGFYIGHFGGIIVNRHARIGNNCNISQGVTLGKANRGRRKGYPTLGDNIYIGPGAVVAGNVRIGNNVAIGANCVVTQDVPDNAVVVGIPGKVISQAGSAGYVNRTDYHGKF